MCVYHYIIKISLSLLLFVCVCVCDGSGMIGGGTRLVTHPHTFVLHLCMIVSWWNQGAAASWSERKRGSSSWSRQKWADLWD